MPDDQRVSDDGGASAGHPQPAHQAAAIGFDAVVLAGGAARRLGGRDKPGQLVAGISLLDRVLAAVMRARTTVVVGPERPSARPVLWTREDPPGGGPLAALAAGLTGVTAPVFVLVAADLPFLTEGEVARLVGALEPPLGMVSRPTPAGALLVDDTGREQWLCGAWRTDAVRRALQGVTLDGGRLRSALHGLHPVALHPLTLPGVALPAGETASGQPPGTAPRPGLSGLPPWTDCDTEDDLRRAREHA